MSTDGNTPTPDPSWAKPADPVPTIVIPVNHPEPIDTGIRVPVLRVPANQALPPPAPERLADPTSTAKSALPDDTAVLKRMIAELVDALHDARQEMEELRQHVEVLLRQRYGPRLPPDNPHQPLLFSEPTTEPAPPATDEPPAETDAVESVPSSEKKKKPHPHGRRRLEDLLPRLPVDRREHTLTEAERVCPCCGGLRHKVGEQTTQQLDYQPARMVRVEHVQFTYSCPHCPEHIVTTPKPPQPIDRGLPGPGLLAAVLTHKYVEHMPLYRQELSTWRVGALVARSTTSSWAGEAAELLQPLVERMKHFIFQSRVIQTDSTPVSVLVAGQPKAQTGHLWPYLGDVAHPYVVFDFSLDRTKEHAHQFLTDYRGYVQADASSGYDILFRPGSPLIEVGCWAHAERYFTDARDNDPVRACQALGFIGSLFAIEARARDREMSIDEIFTLRQRESVPILEAFKTWLDARAPDVLPKSSLGAAFTYVRNQWPALQRYTEAGFLSIDNNAVERTNKLIARGRKNWLFAGSPRGGQTAATLFSITATCQRLEMDAFAYLRDLFTRLPTVNRRPLPPEQLDELLPDRWLGSHPEARYPPQRRGPRDRRPRRRKPFAIQGLTTR